MANCSMGRETPRRGAGWRGAWCGFALLLLLCAPQARADRLLAAIQPDALRLQEPGEDCRAEVVDVAGEPGIRVQYLGTGLRSCVVAEVDTGGIENTRLFLRATMSCENVEFRACLELQALVYGQYYPVRAYENILTGTQPAAPIVMPIELKQGERMEKARLGVRFEGYGTATLSGLELWERGPEGILAGALRVEYLPWLIGAPAGSFLVWEFLRRRLAGRPNGLRRLLRVTLAFAAAYGALLIAGTAAWTLETTSLPRELALLLGTVGTTIFGVAALVMQARLDGAPTESPAPQPDRDNRPRP